MKMLQISLLVLLVFNAFTFTLTINSPTGTHSLQEQKVNLSTTPKELSKSVTQAKTVNTRSSKSIHKESISNADSLTAVTISANITNNQILKSNYTIALSMSQSVSKLSYKLDTSVYYTNISGPLSTYNVILPDLHSQSAQNMFLTVVVYDSSNGLLANTTFSFVLNDQWVFVTYINPQGLILPHKQLNITFDSPILGINWRWDLNNVISTSFSSLPKVTTPSTDGSYRLVLDITNGAGVQQPALDYYYTVDGTAPSLIPITDISGELQAGTQIAFQNDTTLSPNYFNFTFVGSNKYTSTFPIVPAPAGTYILSASVHDILGNTRYVNFTIKAQIGIYTLYPNQAGRPGVPMNITLSETPYYQNYTFYYLNGTVYSSNTSVPNLPIPTGQYTFVLSVMDNMGNWLNKTLSIMVDDTPLTFIQASPVNNSIVYSATTVSLTFDSTPANLIYSINGGSNTTGTIVLPNGAGKYNLTVYASDIALNWITLNLTYTRFYRPALSIANNSVVLNNFTLSAIINFPVTTSYVHWDGNTTNQTLDGYNPISGLHVLNLTLIYNNIVSTNWYDYIINVTVLSFNVSRRLQSGVPIGVIFSESNVQYSWKWNNQLTWSFGQIYSYSVEGSNTLTIQMNSADQKYQFSQSFTFFIDNTPPQILSMTPSTTANTFTVLRSGTPASITFSDKACSSYCYQSLQYSYNQGPYTTIDLTANASVVLSVNLGTIPTNTTPSDFVNLTVIITDNAFNQEVANYTYIIDDFAPVLTGANFMNGSKVTLPMLLKMNFSENTILHTTFFYTNSSSFTANATNEFIGTQIFIPNFFFGNQSVTLNCNATDLYGNSRLFSYHFTTIDPALQLSTNATISALKGSEKIFFFVNKAIQSQKITFHSSNNTFTFASLNTTIPSLLNYAGLLNMTASATDYQGVTVTLKYSIVIDTKAPTFDLSGYKVLLGKSNYSLTKFTSNTSSVSDIEAPSNLTISVFDTHSVISNITLRGVTYGTNGPYELVESFTNSSYVIPITTNDTAYTLILQLRDTYGNAITYTISLNKITEIPTGMTQQDQSASNVGLIITIIGAVAVAGAAGGFSLNKKYNFVDRIRKRSENK